MSSSMECSTSAGTLIRGMRFFDHCVHPMQLAHGDAFHGQQPRFATLALFHLAFDNRPQALILDARRAVSQ